MSPGDIWRYKNIYIIIIKRRRKGRGKDITAKLNVVETGVPEMGVFWG